MAASAQLRPHRKQYSTEEVRGWDAKTLEQYLWSDVVDGVTMRACLEHRWAAVKIILQARLMDQTPTVIEKLAGYLKRSKKSDVLVDSVSKAISGHRATLTVVGEHMRSIIEKELIDPNQQGSDGSTLLHLAVRSRQPKIAKLLLERGANPFIRNRTGQIAYNSIQPEKIIGVMISFENKHGNKLGQPIISHCRLSEGYFQKMDPTIQPSYYTYTRITRRKLNSDEKEKSTRQDVQLPEIQEHQVRSEQKVGEKERERNGDEERKKFQRYHIRGNPVLIELKENNDLHYTLLICKLVKLLDFGDVAFKVILQFNERSFLEQIPRALRLKSREPSFDTLLKPGRGSADVAQKNSKIATQLDQNPEDSAHRHGKQAGGNVHTTKIHGHERPSLPDLISIVMPYFHSTSKKNLTAQREPRKESGLMQLATNKHEPRTLDESYYVGLELKHLEDRNEDQVMSRLSDAEDGDKPVLMVPQLWLWRLDSFIITAVAAEKNLDGPDPVTHLKSELQDRNLLVERDLNSVQITALILSECINFLDRPHSAGVSELIFNEFEKGVANIFDKVQSFTENMDIAAQEIKTEKMFMHEINDIRDELFMIRNVLNQQKDVWDAFREEFAEDIEQWKISFPYLSKTLSRTTQQIQKFLDRTDKTERDAERIKESITELLELKKTYAALADSHSSLEESRKSTNLNYAVITFTVITIIFTPLSFLCSLFALPIDRFQHPNSNGSNIYPSDYIGKQLGQGEGISIGVTITAIGVVYLILYLRRHWSTVASIPGSIKPQRKQDLLTSEFWKKIGRRGGKDSDEESQLKSLRGGTQPHD